MNATAEFDKAGRIIVPKKVREALHFRAGDRVDIEVRGDTAVLSHKAAGQGMMIEKGMWVYDSGVPMSGDTVSGQIETMRERRHRFLRGESSEP